MMTEDFKKTRTLEAHLLIQKWSGDLHMEVNATNEDQIKMLSAYILHNPMGEVNMIIALKLARGLKGDKNFMKSMVANTLGTSEWIKEKKK